MPQLHFYVPEEVAKTLRAKAEASGMSLSKYLSSVVSKGVEDGGWPAGYFEFLAAHPLPEDFQIPEPPPVEYRDWKFD